MTGAGKSYKELLAELLAQAHLTPGGVESLSDGMVTARTVRNHLKGEHAPQEAKVQQIADVLERRGLGSRRGELLAAAARATPAAALPAPSGVEEGATPPADPAGDGVASVAAPAVPAGPAAAAAPGLGRARRRRRLAVPVGVACAAGAVLVIVAAANGNLGRTRDARPAPTVAVRAADPATITFPADGQTVDSPVVVNGASALRVGESLWLVVQPPDGDYYLAGAKRAVRPGTDGAWSFPVGLGRDQRDSGLAFNLLVVVAPTDGAFAAAARQKAAAPGHGGWHDLPPDARRAATVRVILGRYHGAPLSRS